jgi:hypothetical protein
MNFLNGRQLLGRSYGYLESPVLFSAIVETPLGDCHLTPEPVIAYFYFDFNASKKRDPNNFLRSICAQLLVKTGTIPEEIQIRYSCSQNGSRQTWAERTGGDYIESAKFLQSNLHSSGCLIKLSLINFNPF